MSQSIATGIYAKAKSFINVFQNGRGGISSLRSAATKQRYSLYSKYTTKEEKWKYIQSALIELERSSEGNRITPYYDSSDAYTAMWDAVDGARTSVRWHTYICKNDNVGKKTMEKLLAARARGCEVEILYDSAGNVTGRSTMMAPLVEKGIKVVEYRPWRSMLAMYFKRGMRWHLSPGIRNHRKVLVVDNSVAFTGGLNIGDDYAGTAVGGNGRFRDTQCKVEGPAVHHFLGILNDTLATASPLDSEAELRTHLKNGKHLKHGKLKARAVPDSMKDTFSDAGKNLLPKPAGSPSSYTRWRHWAGRAFRFQSRVIQTPSGLRKHPRYKATQVFRRQLQERASVLTKQRIKAALNTKVVLARRERLRQIKQDIQRRFTARTQKYLESSSQVRSFSNSLVGQMEKMKESGRRVSQRLRAARRRHKMEKGVQVTAVGNEPTPHDETLSLNHVQPPPPPPPTEGHAQVLPVNPHTRDWSLQLAYWLVVRKAHSRVWITTPYILPNRKLMNAIICAAQKGVDVRVVVGGVETSDPWFMWYVGHWITHRLLASGVKIYEFQGEKRVLHAKTVVVDSCWSSIGSYNWDVLSNKLLEASIASYDQKLATEMEAHFEKDMSQCIELTAVKFETRLVWYHRVFCWVCYHMVKLSERVWFWNYSDPDMTSKID